MCVKKYYDCSCVSSHFKSFQCNTIYSNHKLKNNNNENKILLKIVKIKKVFLEKMH